MHHSFIVPGLIDEAVVKAQAFRRANDKRNKSEATSIHYHRAGERCNERCYLVKEGANDGEA